MRSHHVCALAALACAACFDLSATSFGAKNDRCFDGGTCEAGLVCGPDFMCVDPCDGVRCSNHGVCGVSDGAAACTCDIGFVVSGLDCLEVGSLGAPCGPSSTCAIGLVCIDAACVEACSQLDCGAHGHCGVIGAIAHCTCDAGYHEAAFTCVDDCTGEACSGHGSCSLAGSTATCTCDSSYSPSGLACVANGCIANGTTTVVCEGGHLLDVDSCDRRIGQHENCGYRGCSGTVCNPVSWVGYAQSELGPWTQYQSFTTGPAGISRTSDVLGSRVVIDEDGKPVVAWTARSPYLRRWSGAGWVGPDYGVGTDQLPDTKAIGDATVALSDDGLPVVAWGSYRTVEQGQEIYLRAWNGSAWIELGGSDTGGGLSDSAGQAHGASVALRPSGSPMVVWSDNGDGHYRIRALQWSGTTWTGFAGPQADYLSAAGVTSTRPKMVIDGAGRPVVSFYSAGDIVVMRFDTGGWQRLGSPFTSSGHSQTDVCIGPGNHVFVVWQGLLSSDWDVFVQEWDGATWLDRGNVSNSPSPSSFPAIACDTAGKALVAWSEGPTSQAQIFARMWAGGAWIQYPPGSASGGGVSNMSGNSKSPSVSMTEEHVCVSWETFGPTTELFLRCSTR